MNTKEIRHIFHLFNQDTPCKKQLLRTLTIAATNDHFDTKQISSYIDLQRPNSVRNSPYRAYMF